MNNRESDRLIRLLNCPPPVSKLVAATVHEFDWKLLAHNLELTPAKRVRELAAAHTFPGELRPTADGYGIVRRFL